LLLAAIEWGARPSGMADARHDPRAGRPALDRAGQVLVTGA
jgi:hypothetical protein